MTHWWGLISDLLHISWALIQLGFPESNKDMTRVWRNTDNSCCEDGAIFEVDDNLSYIYENKWQTLEGWQGAADIKNTANLIPYFSLLVLGKSFCSLSQHQCKAGEHEKHNHHFNIAPGLW